MSDIQPNPSRAIKLVRAHRIDMNAVPALFSEGVEAEPFPVKAKPWFNTESLARSWKQIVSQLAHSLTPPQPRDEKAISPVPMRRQTHPQS